MRERVKKRENKPKLSRFRVARERERGEMREISCDAISIEGGAARGHSLRSPERPSVRLHGLGPNLTAHGNWPNQSRAERPRARHGEKLFRPSRIKQKLHLQINTGTTQKKA